MARVQKVKSQKSKRKSQKLNAEVKDQIWVTKTLKDHLITGYSINERHLLQAQNLTKRITGRNFFSKNARHELLAGKE